MAVSAPPAKEPVSALDTSGAAGDDLREYAIARLKRKRKFGQDAVVYVSVNGLLWLIWAIADRSTDGSIPWPAWPTLAWGFFLALAGWRAYGSWPASVSRPITDTDIQREIERTQGR